MKSSSRMITTDILRILIFFIIFGTISGCVTTTALQKAILRSDIESAKELAKKDANTINQKDTNGDTALILATRHGQDDVARAILEAGADPNIQNDKYSATALIAAAFKGNAYLVDLLSQSGAEVDISAKNGWTPLHMATFKNYYPVVKILTNHGANINPANNEGQTPLLLASQEGHTLITEFLLSHGADPDIQDEDGNTPLMRAVSGSHQVISELLIQRGADIDLQSKENMTAQDIAEKNGLVRFTELFNDIESGSFSPKESANTGALVIFKNLEIKINGEIVSPQSRSAWEWRSATGHFLDLLRESNLFSEIDMLDDTNKNNRAIFLSLVANDSEDTHMGANAAKGFLSGFFTLGLVPPSASYSYATNIELIVEHSNGQTRTYQASSDTTAEWSGDPRAVAYKKKSGNSKTTARRQVTYQTLESLISQLKADRQFFN